MSDIEIADQNKHTEKKNFPKGNINFDRKRKNPFNKKNQKKERRFEDVELLEKRVSLETPPSDVYYYKYLDNEPDARGKSSKVKEEEEKVGHKKFIKINDTSKVKIRFSDLPISSFTSKGLYKAKYVRMTEVQRCTIPHALAGRDMMVCSRTGSGKTLSYCIPLVEKLYRKKWSGLDGLGALIICPVRELAIQTFEVLLSFANLHDMSAGMVIGGKQVDVEKSRIGSMNILVATPGRLLQHMNETPDFNCDNLQMLVIDEVDRTFDMGFQDSIRQIFQNIPLRRVQTMLFSATAQKSLEKTVKKLLPSTFNYYNLNLYESQNENLAIGGEGGSEETKDKDGNFVPKYITPVKLTHYYMEVEAENKLDTLFSFIKSHQKSKCIVFFSSCKQVRHAYESFSKLRCGAPLMEIHGRQKQIKRTAIYFEFVERKNAFLFATDIASRGMDFPAVDWVIQVDLPEDTDTYIHRVGRTARYKFKGSAILMVLPSEMKFVERLQGMNIAMKKLKANPTKTMSITSALQRINAGNNELMHLAQKAFVCYIRSIFKNGDKEVFDINSINHSNFAQSLGLVNAPVIEFVEGDQNKTGKKSKLHKLKEKIRQKKQKTTENEQPSDDENKDDQQDDAKVQELDDKDQQDQDDELFTVKRTIVPDENDVNEEIKPVITKNKLKKIKKGGLLDGKNKIYFDNSGQQITSLEFHMKQKTFGQEESNEYIQDVKKSLHANKELDQQIATDRVKQKRIKKRKQKEDFRKQMESEKHHEYYEVEGEDDQDAEDDQEDE